MDIETILQGYEESGEALVRPYEAIDPAILYAAVADSLPKAPCRILDVGAGTGRDAAWFAAQGHRILAVEPVRALRAAGQRLRPEPAISWVDDRLPDLPRVAALGERFDYLLVSGVWQHLQRLERQQAILVLAALLGKDGRLIMSLRHGPGAANRPCFGAVPEETIESG